MTITSPSGWLARCARRGSSDEYDELPVAYFRIADDEAMIVVPGEPRPRPAISLPGFKGLESCPRTAAAIPSQPGWLIKSRDGDGDEFTRPIIGWVVDERGNGAPLVVYDLNGRCYAAPNVFGEYTIHGPDDERQVESVNDSA